jgi:hypothetical protein
MAFLCVHLSNITFFNGDVVSQEEANEAHRRAEDDCGAG